MNTPKYNFEQQIKKQIDEREINPSRDLWAEIESKTSTQTFKKSKINWFLVAASLGLLLSFGIIFINNDTEIIETQIVENNVQPEILQAEPTIKNEVSPLLAEKTQPIATKNKVVISAPETQIFKPEVVAVKSELPSTKEKQERIIPEIYKNQVSNNFAKIDSAKSPVKRKKYIDASTLLFSVEHKDVIENSKDGSNVATIDLYSK